MVKIIKRVASNDFFTKKVHFTDNRYRHLDLSAKLLFLEKSLTLENKIYDTKKSMLDKMVKNHKSASSETTTIEEQVNAVLHEMNTFFDDDDCLLESITTVPVYYLLFRQARLDKKIKLITRTKLLNFVKNVKQNHDDAENDVPSAKYDLLEYDNLSKQGTNDASSIRSRLQIISEYILNKKYQL